MYVREDWTLFRTLPTLCQKAGVSPDRLRRVVMKELTDNALDVSDNARIGQTEDGGYFVQDEGPGIPGSPDEIAALFSLNRPLTSSKLERLPSRGALGNGLRVVAGAVYVSGGRLTVYTRNQRLHLTPREDGSTAVEVEPIDFPTGTRVEVWLGPAIPDDPDPLELARLSMFMADGHSTYRGKTSPHWYDPDTFYELLQAAGEEPVRSLVANRLDGCSGARAGQICAFFKNRSARSLTRQEAARLLEAAQALAPTVKADRLGYVGRRDELGKAYDRSSGTFQVAGVDLPYVIEVWVDAPYKDNYALIFVNRTLVTGSGCHFAPAGNKAERELWGMGIDEVVKTGREPLWVGVNVQTPYMPVTSDGKQPDLSALGPAIAAAIAKAVKQAKRFKPAGEKRPSQVEVILQYLPEAIAKTSGNSAYRYAIRQLYYSMRPYLQNIAGVGDPNYSTFTRIIADYERAHGTLPGLYRDSRGTLYHPHTGEEIAVGTLSVESYERPVWTFNKILYSEKEGLFSVLKAERWPERHDCALLTAKGHATGAAKDILDYIGDGDEPITVFCIHDADAYGTTIYQALQEETRARPGRRIQIINLGIEPDEALQMDLEVEKVPLTKERKPVASYVAPYWQEWLQHRRIELNAMTAPQFIAWLDAKIAPYEGRHWGKIIPPRNAMRLRLYEETHKALEDSIRDRILREAGFDDLVHQAYNDLSPEIEIIAETLDGDAIATVEADRAKHWTAPVIDHARGLAARFG